MPASTLTSVPLSVAVPVSASFVMSDELTATAAPIANDEPPPVPSATFALPSASAFASVFAKEERVTLPPVDVRPAPSATRA
jgi:hypothetical protein